MQWCSGSTLQKCSVAVRSIAVVQWRGVALQLPSCRVLKMNTTASHLLLHLVFRRILLDDLHILDPLTCRWSQPELSGFAASKRAFHAMVPLDGRVLVFGGRNGANGRFAEDTALIDLTPQTVATPGPIPPRFAHATASHPAVSHLIPTCPTRSTPILPHPILPLPVQLSPPSPHFTSTNPGFFVLA